MTPISGALLLLLFVWPAQAQSSESSGISEPSAADAAGSGGIAPYPAAAIAPATPPSDGVAWAPLVRQSWHFLNMMHAFRLATEPGTREGMKGSFFGGYVDSIRNLHGWADGDPFFVNYIGHPMMGSVAGYLFAQNDRRYREVEFGRNPEYWRGRLRATAFSFAFSTQFEIGPYSEATVGKIQSRWPQYGLGDLVTTPVIGMGWMIGEDAIDQLLIRRIERWTGNNWARIMTRVWLNPTRTVSNVTSGKVPWHRESRGGVYAPLSYVSRRSSIDPPIKTDPPPGVAPFEFSMTFLPRHYVGTGITCAGGGGAAAFRLARQWQLVFDVTGCNLLGLPTEVSGDVITYAAGPRWKARGSRRWSPHLQMLIGGQHVAMERFDREAWRRVAPLMQPGADVRRIRSQYATREDANALAVTAGGGLDLQLHDALALRLANLEFRRAWTPPVMGVRLNQGLQFSTGVVLHMGTW